ncbi:MAG TPA: ribonuclease BN [Betaproteobacteria bacterium]|nr:ribonuclease BN [Betaproteobacteria bacterium]
MRFPLPELLRRLLRLSRFLLRRFIQDRCPQVAASLTYTTLLSLVPVLTITLTVISAFPVFGEWVTHLKIFIVTNLVPEMAAKIITVYMQQFSENAGRLTALGLVALAVTAFLLMLTIEHVFNAIWRVRRQRSLVQRFLIYWAVLTLGPVLMGASLSLTSYLIGLSQGWIGHIPLLGADALNIVPALLTTAALALLYRLLPNRHVPFSHALAGGVVAGAIFEVVKKGFAVYLTNIPTYTLVYGAFAIIPIFLIWVYLSWLVVLVGAEIAANLSHWRAAPAKGAEGSPGGGFYDALRVLRALHDAQQTGEAASLNRLRRRLHLGFDELEEILGRLASARFVQQTAGGDWMAARGMEDIRVREIFHAYVFAPPVVATDAEPNEAALAEALRTISGHCDDAMDASLSILFQR